MGKDWRASPSTMMIVQTASAIYRIGSIMLWLSSASETTKLGVLITITFISIHSKEISRSTVKAFSFFIFLQNVHQQCSFILCYRIVISMDGRNFLRRSFRHKSKRIPNSFFPPSFVIWRVFRLNWSLEERVACQSYYSWERFQVHRTARTQFTIWNSLFWCANKRVVLCWNAEKRGDVLERQKSSESIKYSNCGAK